MVEGIKVVARAHQTMIWERHRHMLRLRSALWEYFPAALEAFDDLTAPDTLELLGAAPDPARAARLSRSRIGGALKRARRHDVEARAERIQTVLRAEYLTQPPELVADYTATTTASVAVITAFSSEIATLQVQVDTCFGRHPDAAIYRSQPGLGEILGAPGTRRVRRRPRPLPGRPGPEELRRLRPDHPRIWEEDRGVSQVRAQPAPRRAPAVAGVLRATRLTRRTPTTASSAPAAPGTRPHCASSATAFVGILHGCLKTRTPYDEHTAWGHHQTQDQQNCRLTSTVMGCRASAARSARR